jgi:acetyltransferase
VLKTGSFYPDHGLERIVAYHERQERRFAEAAIEASQRHDKPVLSATELVHTDRDYGNAGPLALKEAGRVCHPSAHRAVRALKALVDYAEYRGSLAYFPP